MKSYSVTLQFTNLDNFMDTSDQASMSVEIKSDSYSHAYILAERLCKVMEADHFNLDEK